jgi:hypothetical protein
MGFFSWECPLCKHSIRAPYVVNTISAWMNDAVLVNPDGSTVKGAYDGYGRIATDGGEVEIDHSGGEPCLCHAACYALKPGYTGPSEYARDQGYFVGEYDPKEPRNRRNLTTLTRAIEKRTAAERAESRASALKSIAKYEAKGEPVPEWLTAGELGVHPDLRRAFIGRAELCPGFVPDGLPGLLGFVDNADVDLVPGVAALQPLAGVQLLQELVVVLQGHVHDALAFLDAPLAQVNAREAEDVVIPASVPQSGLPDDVLQVVLEGRLQVLPPRHGLGPGVRGRVKALPHEADDADGSPSPASSLQKLGGPLQLDRRAVELGPVSA